MALGRELFKLYGTVALDGADKSEEQLKDIDEKVKSTDKKMSGFGKTMGVVGGAIGTAVVAGVAALGKLTMSSIDSAKELQATNAKYDVVFGEFTGMADQMVADFQKLTPASKASARSLVSGFQDMLVPMGFARGEATEMTGELFNLTGALTNMNSATQTSESVSAKFQAALGREYTGLKELGIVTGAQEVKQKALEMGLDMSTPALERQAEAQALLVIATEQSGDALAAYNKESLDTKTKMEILKAKFTDVQASIGTAFLPVLDKLITMLNDNMPQIEALLVPIMDALAVGLEAIIPILPTVINAIMMIFKAITPLLPLLADIIAELLPPLIELIVPIIELLMQILNDVIPPLIPVIKTLAKILMTVLGVAFEALQPFIDGAIKAFTGLIDFITGVFSGDWKKAWGGIVDYFSGIFASLGGLIKAPLNVVIGLINKVFSSLGSINIPDWVPKIGGTSFSLPQIPKLATGTDYFQGGMALVGEQGAELVNMPRGSQVNTAEETKGMMGDTTINVFGDTSPDGIARRQRLDARRRALGTI